MRKLAIYVSALLSLSYTASSSRHSAQLRDLQAFPKYEVIFLNDLPLSSSDAELVKAGLDSSDDFLGSHVASSHSGGSSRRRLGDGSDGSGHRPEVVPMSLGDGSAADAQYLCMLPESNATESQLALLDGASDVEEELDPQQGWAALSHLDGKCLYLKMGWFTYSYCHNSHIRQFREARHAHPHPPGGYTPEEDTGFEAYTLGMAQTTHPSSRKPAQRQPRIPAQDAEGQGRAQDVERVPRPAGQMTPAAPEVAFGLGAHSRYLVQRWSDGTRCDKTGRPRETEVQIHCSMTSGDTIYMIKELAICQYVLVVHSPHLCSLPGFSAEVEARVEPALVRCREVLPDDEFRNWEAARQAPPVPVGEIEGEGTDRAPDEPESERSQTVPRGFEHKPQPIPAPAPGEAAVLQKLHLGAIEKPSKDLDAFVKQALQALGLAGAAPGDGGADGGDEAEENVMVLQMEEDEDGTMWVDAEVLVGKDGVELLSQEEQDSLVKLIAEQLNLRYDEMEMEGDEGEGEQRSGHEGFAHDEL